MKRLFGRTEKGFGDLGELRKQRKPPRLRVLFIVVPENGQRTFKHVAIQNADTSDLESYIKRVGRHLESKMITQEDAEIILDFAYAELQTRVT